jgi:LDH2 family malate/lactate/ureidoglycolate dehydrogenase
MRASVEDVRRIGSELFVAAGASERDAETVMTHLLEAEEMGLRSHGVMRVAQYMAEIEAGELDPRAAVSVETTQPGRAAVDGGGTFGQVVGIRMAQVAVELARLTGIGLVTGRRMGHTGRIGAYPEWIAAQGLVGIAVCSGPPSGHWVAPFGGREGRIATNPIAFGYPVAGGPPVVADFSTAATAEGVIRSLSHRGLDAPDGWLRDAQGEPTTEPGALYTSPRGTIQPFGGAQGFRGTALGLFVEVLATLLAGDEVDDRRRTGSNLAVMAIATGIGFADLAAGMNRHIRSATPIDPSRPVLLPGQREQINRAAAGQTIEIDTPTWTAIADAARRAGIAGLANAG